MKSTSVLVLLSTVAILLSATQASATPQVCIMSVPGVPGESTVVHDGIDLLTFSWSVHNATRAIGSGGGASKPQFSEFTVTKHIDKSSPHFMLGCAAGVHYPHVTLMCRKAGGERPQDYLVYTLTEVLISSYQEVGSSGNDIPTDQISFNYGRIDFSYRPQNPDGTLGPPVDACWDVHSNRACH